MNRIKEIGASYGKSPTQVWCFTYKSLGHLRIKDIRESRCTNAVDLPFVPLFQVSLNWLTCQGNVVPIPGAKNASQAKEFAGALGWSLTGDEVEELRTLAREIKGIRMPIEES